MGSAAEPKQPTPARYRFSYWATVLAFLSLQAFMTAPSPLYGLYAHRDHFSSLTITLVYAAYSLGVIATLFFAGHLSDQYGRRPFLLAALTLDAVSALVFIAWPALPGLYLARMLCGIAVGLTASTATAYLSELHLAHRRPDRLHRTQLLAGSITLGGLGLGAQAVGLTAQYLPHPLTVPYLVMLGAFGLSAVGILLAAETRPRLDPRPRYRPQRAAVPPEARSEFAAALIGVALAFAVMGMVIGLAGTFLTGVLHHTSTALAGAAIGLVFAAGVAVTTATAAWKTRSVLAASTVLIIIGLALLVVSAWLPHPSLALFLVAAAFIGAGGSTMFKGSLAVIVAISPRSRLAESLAAFFLSGYTGISVPVIAVGIALQKFDTRDALLGFAIVIALGILAAAPFLLAPQARRQPHRVHIGDGLDRDHRVHS
jgi:MFS family permease